MAMAQSTPDVRVTDDDYRRLLEFRTGLRRFLRWSERLAAEAGLTPVQHQLLLAIRGHADPRGPTISEVAGYLLVRHHSVVQLVDRAERAGLVTRVADSQDGRIVRLTLSGHGSARLAELAAATKEELSRIGSRLGGLWQGLQ
jgi:DNA-binding MarR family transcriptional regulator